MADDAAEALEQLGALEGSLTELEQELQPLFSTPLKALANGLPALEAAKLNIVGAFAINTLFYIFLKTQGVDPEAHPVKQQLDRVKKYFKKIRDASADASAESR